ncbi:MAG: vWA domain-containing protein, partial [Actinomycetes bacterium]
MRARWTRGFAAVVAAGAVLIVAAGPAVAGEVAADSGAGGGRSLTVDSVDATGRPVVVHGVLRGASPASITVASKGDKVRVSGARALDPEGTSTETVLVIDNSIALGNTIVQIAKNGMEQFLPGAGVSARAAVVSTGGGATINSGMSASKDEAAAGLDEVQPSGTSALWDALVRAADLFTDGAGSGLRQVVVFAAAPDSASRASSSAAVAALRAAGAQVRIVALPVGVDLVRLQDMVGSLGGSLVVGQSDDQIVPADKAVAQALRDRFVLNIPASGAAGSLVPLTLVSGSAITDIAYEPSKVTTGSVALAPVTSAGGLSAALAGTPGIGVLLVLLGAVAVGLLVWSVLSLVVPDADGLTGRLAAYEPGTSDDDAEDGEKSVATTALLQRAVKLTGEVAERRGTLERTELLLEHANLPLRAAEALFFLGAAVFVIFMLVFVATSNLLFAVV